MQFFEFWEFTYHLVIASIVVIQHIPSACWCWSSSHFLATWYEEPALEKTLIPGKDWEQEKGSMRMRQGWMASPGGCLVCFSPWGCKSRTQLSDRTDNHPIEFSSGPLQPAPSLYSLITDNPWPASYIYSFACSRILHSWNHSVYELFCRTQHDVWESCILLPESVVYSFIRCDIPSYGSITSYKWWALGSLQF